MMSGPRNVLPEVPTTRAVLVPPSEETVMFTIFSTNLIFTTTYKK